MDRPSSTSLISLCNNNHAMLLMRCIKSLDIFVSEPRHDTEQIIHPEWKKVGGFANRVWATSFIILRWWTRNQLFMLLLLSGYWWSRFSSAVNTNRILSGQTEEGTSQQLLRPRCVQMVFFVHWLCFVTWATVHPFINILHAWMWFSLPYRHSKQWKINR